MARSWAEQYFKVSEGPFGVVRFCTLCDFYDVRKKTKGTGRGTGMREGNKQRGRLIQHIKQAHPEKAPKEGA